MPPSVEVGFELTHAKVRLMNWLSASFSIVSFLLCLSIIIASWSVYRCPAARSSLDRISFRLLIWTMLVELIYDVSYIVCVLLKPSAAPHLCTTSVLGIMVSIGITNYLVMCVALNLCLVLVFGISVTKLEKYYIMGSFFFGTIIPLIPAAKNSFGWDPVFKICWIRAKTRRNRIVLLLMSLYAWQILSCLLASLFVLLTLTALYHQRSVSNRFAHTAELHRVSLGYPESIAGMDGILHTLNSHTSSKNKRSSISSNTFRDRFLSVALRVIAYPMALVTVNGFIAAADLRISFKGGVDTKELYVVYVIYYILYGARGGIFACIVLFVDPSLRRGVSLLRKSRRRRVMFPDPETVTTESSAAVAQIVIAQLPATVARSIGWEDYHKDLPTSSNDIMVKVEVQVELEEVLEDGRVVVIAPPHLAREYPSRPLAVLRSRSGTASSSGSDRSARIADLAFHWEMADAEIDQSMIPEENEEEVSNSERDMTQVGAAGVDEQDLQLRQTATNERDAARQERAEEAAFRLVASRL